MNNSEAINYSSISNKTINIKALTFQHQLD